MKVKEINDLFAEFIKSYDARTKDQIWQGHSNKFREFWNDKIVNGNPNLLKDEDIDEVVKILDRNGKGNRKDSEAVAKAMIPQGAWRRMFHELCSDKRLSQLITNIFQESDPKKKSVCIDELYKVNEGKKNNLTGKSGNAINAMLTAYDPVHNVSMISLKDRLSLINYLEFPVTFDPEKATLGISFIETNKIILEGFHNAGIEGSARTLSYFCYSKNTIHLWKNEFKVKGKVKGKHTSINVTIPSDKINEDEEIEIEDTDIVQDPRESIKIQALLAKIGSQMGLSIWLPKSDRSRVLKLWSPAKGELLDELPLSYDETAMKTIENIDVLWLNRRSIVRAFEVEHTTSIYSGILRMADLLALLPNINIKLHIVAPISRKEKVFDEIQRPVFSLLESGPMSDFCTFLSYDMIVDLSTEKHLGRLSDTVLDDIAEPAE